LQVRVLSPLLARPRLVVLTKPRVEVWYSAMYGAPTIERL
jgi:hypothetical protein